MLPTGLLARVSSGRQPRVLGADECLFQVRTYACLAGGTSVPYSMPDTCRDKMFKDLQWGSGWKPGSSSNMSVDQPNTL